MTQMSLTDFHLMFLPLVYIIPYEMLIRCPTLQNIPRTMGEIQNNSAQFRKLVRSRSYLAELLHAMALLAFPHFGFRGSFNHYSFDFPMRNMGASLHLWLEGVEKFEGWGWKKMNHLPPEALIDFCEPEDVHALFEKIVKWAIEKENWGPIIQVLREMPCEEDFAPQNTYVYQDFIRKWYHTRAKHAHTVSLEECPETSNVELRTEGALSNNFIEQVEADDFCERFKATLTPKDMEILELRVEGYSYKEIAKKLGYKNHSGVIKRMEAIKKRFIEYENETGP